jgi:malonyl-CoA decarboxylase
MERDRAMPVHKRVTPVRLARFFGLSPKPNGVSPRDASRAAQKLIDLCHSLLSERGEVSGRHLASEILADYQALEPAAVAAFFDLLVQEFSPDPAEVGRAGDAYRKEPTPENLARLQDVVEPPRQELIRRLNMAHGGTRALIEMRALLLKELDRHPGWAPINADLSHLLTSWFNRGFLVLRRIDWQTPASVLEKLIEYEAVHQIQGWRDLRRRLEADRRCYGFFHPALPDEPIIFIEVALTRGMSAKVQPLLDPDSPLVDPETADSAMFYSITNCQKGLRGVPFGSFLIKQVAEEVGKELPRLKKFATVSPVPDLRQWLRENINSLKDNPAYAKLADSIARLEEPSWLEDKQLCAELQRDLIPLCAYYLVRAKQGKEPRDPVARFHLRNGARLERINWLGDTSAIGMQRSAGIMANYVYKLGDVERNHESYIKDFKVNASREVEMLAKRFSQARQPVNQ